MDELEQLNYDTSKPISDEQASQLADQQEQYAEYRKQEEAQRLSNQNAAQADQNQRNAEIDDSRNKENWGAGEYTKELFSAVGGGLQDTVSSLVTLPERIIDAATGEMAREAKTKEGYKPEWDDFFVDDSNPIETKTWWGGLIRGLTHYTSLAAVPVPGFGVGAKLGAGTTKAVTKIVPKLAANKKAMGLAVKFGKEARRGIKVDLLSKYSQDDNALGVLDQHFPGVGGPLATQKHDHPMVKTFKNVVEGMGLGIISDSVLEGMQVGFKVGGGKVSEAFKASRNMQELEKGRALLKGGEKTAARIAEIEKQLGANPNKEALDKAKTKLDEATEQMSFVSRSGNKKAKARATLDLDKAENEYEVAFRNHDRWTPEGTDKEELLDELTELRKQRDTSAESYDPHKNEPREVHQGNATSIENIDDVLETQQIMKTEWGANKGSLGGVFSKQSITNMMESADMGWKELDKYAKAIENSA